MSSIERIAAIKVHYICQPGSNLKFASPVLAIRQENDIERKQRLLAIGNPSVSGKDTWIIKHKPIETLVPSPEAIVDKIGDSQIEIRIGQKIVFLPFGFIQEVWKDSLGDVNIALSCDLVIDQLNDVIALRTR